MSIISKNGRSARWRGFGVNGERRAGRVGIWVVAGGGEAKIAAIGVRVRRWVTYHGMAINIDPDLDHYRGIIPCGIDPVISGLGVTSLARLSAIAATMADVDAACARPSPQSLTSRPPADEHACSKTRRRGRWPTGCGRRASPRSSARIICLGPDGPIGRMVASRQLSSMILWGPPGCGKTTIARLLADRHRASFRAVVGGVFRGRRSAPGVRRGAQTARDGPRHAALRRRDPPLQPRPAGRLSAGCRGRHRDPGRRHHREPVLRADRRVAVARPGLRAAPARRRRPRNPAARAPKMRSGTSCRSPTTPARRCARWPTATAAFCSTSSRRSPGCRRARRSGRPSSRASCSSAPRSTTRRRKAITI